MLRREVSEIGFVILVRTAGLFLQMAKPLVAFRTRSPKEIIEYGGDLCQ